MPPACQIAARPVPSEAVNWPSDGSDAAPSMALSSPNAPGVPGSAPASPGRIPDGTTKTLVPDAVALSLVCVVADDESRKLDPAVTVPTKSPGGMPGPLTGL